VTEFPAPVVTGPDDHGDHSDTIRGMKAAP